MTTAVSATVGLLCLIAAALIWTVGQKHTPRLVVVLTFVGTLGIANTVMGGWLRSAVGWVDDITGQLTGALTGAVIVGLIGMVAFYVLIVHVWKRNITTKTLIVAAVAPLAVTSIPGVVGQVAMSLTGALATATATLVGVVF